VRAVSLDHSEALALNQPRVAAGHQFKCLQPASRGSAEGSGRAETQVAPVAYVCAVPVWTSGSRRCAGAAASPAGSAAKGSAPARMSTTAPETARSTNNLTARFPGTVYEVEATPIFCDAGSRGISRCRHA